MDWYYAQQNSQEWVDMTNALHQGTVADLNLYSLNLTYPLLGWSQFPWWYADAPLQARSSLLCSFAPTQCSGPSRPCWLCE